MESARLDREHRTIAIMVDMYCRENHASDGARCGDCQALLNYADQRIRRCPHGLDKPSCTSCTIHCYQQVWRERMRVVMRYAGPRMLWRHPWLALRHLVDSRRSTPLKRSASPDGSPKA